MPFKAKKKSPAPRNKKTSTRTCETEDDGEARKSQMQGQLRKGKTTNKNASVSQNEIVAPTKEEKKLVFNFAKKTLEKGPMGLRTEFQAMKRGNDLTKMTVFVENNAKGRNRYKDVGCLDESRVKLANFPGGDYIHANYVETPCAKNRFICTQAPLDATCPDFWHMMIQEKVENIIMLCNITEKGAKKCHEYYPTAEVPQMKFGDYVVNFVASKMFKLTCPSDAKIRETTVECEFKGQKQKTTHFHWIDWPDRGVPPADMAVVQLLNRIKPTTQPIVVHCSAGIGRTGSVVLIQSIMESIQSGQEVQSCDKLLIRLREQRNNSIQTDHQYLFVHQVMLNYFFEYGYLEPSAKCHLERFKKDYDKIVIQN